MTENSENTMSKEIQHHIGYKFLKFILEDDVNEIIEFVRDSIERLL
jgi:hypothetical protein